MNGNEEIQVPTQDEKNQQSQFAPNAAIAVCPHCGMDPAMLTVNEFQLGKFHCVEMHCPRCRKIIAAQVLGVVQPSVVGAEALFGIRPQGRD